MGNDNSNNNNDNNNDDNNDNNTATLIEQQSLANIFFLI